MTYSIVHYHEKGLATGEDDCFKNQETGWYFFDETFSFRYGPFETESIAFEKLDYYVKTELAEKKI